MLGTAICRNYRDRTGLEDPVLGTAICGDYRDRTGLEDPVLGNEVCGNLGLMADKKGMERYLSFLQGLLTPPRLEHSLGVMQVMAELASIYSLDRAQAMAAGLLHDAARDLTTEDQLALAEKAGIALADPCEQHPVYLHALVGAVLVAEELGFTDRAILDAIAAHSYARIGPGFDAPLAQCLRFADILAPSHEWLGMKKLKGVVYARRTEEAALLQSGWLIEYFGEQGVPVHPNLERQYDALASRVRVTDGFFERW